MNASTEDRTRDLRAFEALLPRQTGAAHADHGDPNLITAAILAIPTEVDAHRFVRGYVAFLESSGEPRDLAIEIARSAVVWSFALGMSRQRCMMWQRVIHLDHPQRLHEARIA